MWEGASPLPQWSTFHREAASSVGPDHVLDLLKRRQPPRAQLAADAALLVTAPRRLREDHLRCVDPHHAGLQGIGHAFGGFAVAADHAGYQAEIAVVGQGDGLVFRGKASYTQHRSEDFLLP